MGPLQVSILGVLLFFIAMEPGWTGNAQRTTCIMVDWRQLLIPFGSFCSFSLTWKFLSWAYVFDLLQTRKIITCEHFRVEIPTLSVILGDGKDGWPIHMVFVFLYLGQSFSTELFIFSSLKLRPAPTHLSLFISVFYTIFCVILISKERYGSVFIFPCV